MFAPSGFRPLMGELRLNSKPSPLGQGPAAPAPSAPTPEPVGAAVTPSPAPVIAAIEPGISSNSKLLIIGGLAVAALLSAICLD